MTKVRFKIEVDTSDKNQTDALNNLLQAIGGQHKGSGTSAQMSIPFTPFTPSATPKNEGSKRKRRTKAEIAAEKEKPLIEKAPEVEEVKDVVNVPSLEDVKKALSKVIQEGIKAGTDDNRDKAAAKLQSFGEGVLNVSSLPEEHYVEFIEFCESL